MIERQNILNLFGKDSRKYHSCLLTSYSFDFLFFEQRILPILHAAGIININIFVDANMLQKQLTESIDKKLHGKKSYSIIPVFMDGAFHPKLILAVGKQKGLLGIGSGNFTSSGMNGNEEIWAAFHTSSQNDKTIELFKIAHNYFLKLQPYVYGTNKKKINWIEDNSTWYQSLVERPENTPVIINDKEFRILESKADKSIYDELLDILPKQPIAIKILSPYYNDKGDLIENLMNDLATKKCHCIIESKFGTLPYRIPVTQKIDFSDWNAIQREKIFDFSRLHAKAFQFEYKNENYFLFGSTNATKEAFGTKKRSSKNAEVSVLMKTSAEYDFFNELGIYFPDKGNYDLNSYTSNIHDQQTLKTAVKPEVIIYHAEIDDNNLIIYCNDDYTDLFEIIIQDANDETISKKDNQKVSQFTRIEDINITNKNAFKVAFFKNSRVISNYAFIHHLDLLVKTNPNPKYARFNELINKSEFGDIELLELLEYANFKKAKQNQTQKLKSSSKSSYYDEGELEEIPISVEEFNKSEDSSKVKGHYEDYQTAALEEFLNELCFESDTDKEKLDESKETKALNSLEEGIDEIDFKVEDHNIELSYKDAMRLKDKIHVTFSKITTYLKHHKADLQNAYFHQKEFELSANFDYIKSLLIGSHLILNKANEVYREFRAKVKVQFSEKKDLKIIIDKYSIEKIYNPDSNNENIIEFLLDKNLSEGFRNEIDKIKSLKIITIDEFSGEIIYHPYININLWPKYKEFSNIEDLIIDGLGSFLFLLKYKEEEYAGNDRIRWVKYKERLLLRYTLILLLYSNSSRYNFIKKLLLLNMYYLLTPEEIDLNYINNNLLELRSKLNLNSLVSDQNIDEANALFKDFIEWKNLYYTDKSKLKKHLENKRTGEIIFDKRYGFAGISTVYDNKLVNLFSPFACFDEKQTTLYFKDVLIGLNPVFFF